jgi:hypothetical protein
MIFTGSSSRMALAAAMRDSQRNGLAGRPLPGADIRPLGQNWPATAPQPKHPRSMALTWRTGWRSSGPPGWPKAIGVKLSVRRAGIRVPADRAILRA